MHACSLPVRSFKCVVELTLHEVSAPGARLASKENLYLNVCLLGQQRRTRLVAPLFPLKFADHLIFEKTFKFCRDPTDVVNFLDDLHVLVELIQLGSSENTEVMSHYETNARDFLFPDSQFKTDFHGPQRDVRMTMNQEFPGSISPQLKFSTSIRIDETQTPSLDILREYETRFIPDPVIEMNKKAIINKKKRAKSASQSPIKPGILRHNDRQESFANHTISSAIKADYIKPEVKFKLSGLNSSVRKNRVIKQVPKLNFDYDQFSPNFQPFVVRKVEDKLILRKPELHDVLNDGLVLTKKNPKGQHKVVNVPRNKGSPGSTSSRSVSRSRSASKSRSLNSSRNESDFINDSSLFHTVSKSNNERNPILSHALNDQRKRQSRSTDPKSGHAHRLGKSLNRNLQEQNSRPSSAASNRSPSRFQDTDFDLLPEAGDFRKFDTTLENCNLCSNSHSSCDVCQNFKYRTQQDNRGHRFHRDETNPNKSNNRSSVFNKVTRGRENDPLNETQMLDSDFHQAFVDNYSTNSFRKANDACTQSLLNKKRNKYPRNKSFSYYAPPCKQNADWKYNRYYPWLFNYTEYLRELEDELYMLKVKSHCMENQ